MTDEERLRIELNAAISITRRLTAEIERLTAENERLRAVVNEQAAAITAAIRTIERQQAELVDMRRALKL